MKKWLDADAIDPTAFSIDVTSKVGATAKWAFRRSVEENTGHCAEQVREHHHKLEEWPALNQEVFANLYDPGECTDLEPDEMSSLGKNAMNALELNKSFQTMRSAACAHRIIAAEAAAKTSSLLAESMGIDQMSEEDCEKQDDRADRADQEQQIREGLEDAGASEEMIQQAIDEAVKKADKSGIFRKGLAANLEKSRESGQFSKELSDIAGAAQKKSDAVGLMRGFGLTGSSEDGDDGIDGELLDLVSNNEMLLKILKECGRLRQAAASRGMADSVTGNCDVVGVVPGDDPTRLLAHELVMMDDPDLEMDVLSRLIDGEALCWEMEDQEPKNQGDVVLLVDRSGSMEGQTMITARAIAAAALLNALKQKRRVVLTMFDHEAITEVIDGPKDLKKALRLIGLKANGGTKMDVALHSARKSVDCLREPDVLIITDGELQSNLWERLEYPADTVFRAVMLNGVCPEFKWLDEQWSVEVSNEPSQNGLCVDIVKGAMG